MGTGSHWHRTGWTADLDYASRPRIPRIDGLLLFLFSIFDVTLMTNWLSFFHVDTFFQRNFFFFHA